ncbi:DUF58 domain-containing protein [Shewanella benthica]|uniref:DUF58 domain-containing protein n=1 Tax=Shewanella benthica TaxID=43661 RepID=UPI00187AA523|nr:DUF58 domain-containing protein [Shewanella benthica]MBE7215937.1 DUF58 domain-containing protein [Shewanella benthica]MCL1063629.1 DUF58 domain-containing protein [Shewanella benthica]
MNWKTFVSNSLPKPKSAPQQGELDARVYVEKSSLIALKNSTKGFSFLPSNSRTTILSGRHYSKVRGRGLNFEELRHYQEGDEVKSIDWNVTLRTGKPHVRVFSEEKERQVLVCVDQRQSMFFGSQAVMKSVVAAQVAALCIWRVLQDGDRIGGMVFSEHHREVFKARRDARSAIHFIDKICEANHALKSGQATSEDNTLVAALEEMTRLKLHNSTLILISDWLGFDQKTEQLIRYLQRKNELILVHISDPLERDLQDIDNLVASDGEYQLHIKKQSMSHSHKAFIHAFSQEHLEMKEQLAQTVRTQTTPVINLATSGDEITHFKSAFNLRANS